MFKLSPDINADVHRIQKIKEAKNEASSSLFSHISSVSAISLDFSSSQKSIFDFEPQKTDNSIERIVKFINSFANPQVGLEETVEKFGIRLN